MKEKLQELKTELRSEREKNRESSRLAKELKAKLKTYEAQKTKGLKPVVVKGSKTGKREGAAVVILSDWHVEEVVKPGTVNGLNEYNPEIARERATRLAEGIIRLVEMNRDVFDLRVLVLGLLGDFISGYIHEELVEVNAFTPPVAIFFAEELLSMVIDTLVARGNFDRILVPCTVGNHGRTTAKMHIAKRVETSYEWMLYNMLARKYAKTPGVEFHVAEGEHVYLEAYGRTLRFMHGDSIKGGGGIGGVLVPILRHMAKLEKFKKADITHIGHFHTLSWLSSVVVNGSLIGYSPYALSFGADFEPPQQAFYILDSKRGRSVHAPIWVDPSESKDAA